MVSAFGAFYGVLFWLTAAAVAGGLAQAVLLPLLCDLYPPEVRARVIGLYVGGAVAVLAATTGALAAATTMGLSWRVVFVTCARIDFSAVCLTEAASTATKVTSAMPIISAAAVAAVRPGLR